MFGMRGLCYIGSDTIYITSAGVNLYFDQLITDNSPTDHFSSGNLSQVNDH